MPKIPAHALARCGPARLPLYIEDHSFRRT
ncbi:Uncharacterised protein [Bordetella pertussis]|nr:Uncharacterised protein [Bordetella pertussis]